MNEWMKLAMQKQLIIKKTIQTERSKEKNYDTQGEILKKKKRRKKRKQYTKTRNELREKEKAR